MADKKTINSCIKYTHLDTSRAELQHFVHLIAIRAGNQHVKHRLTKWSIPSCYPNHDQSDDNHNSNDNDDGDGRDDNGRDRRFKDY